MSGAMKCGILIPAYNPDERLISLAGKLEGFSIVIVNDGSDDPGLFSRLRKVTGVTVLTHPENRGKGAALKTGFRYMLEMGFTHAVTADADGQHSPEDIRRIAEITEEHPDQLILGVRELSQMPLRSRFGNGLTRFLFRSMYGVSLTDTQTGLRGLPLRKALLSLAGERYEYETELLIYTGELFPAGIFELPIATIYSEHNESSHFRPIKDGLRIYAILFRSLPKFLLVSLLSFGLDYVLFLLLYYVVFHRAETATVLARLCSGSFNYLCNSRLVFSGKGTRYTAKNYLLLACGLLLANVALAHLFITILGFPAAAVKLCVECTLYFVSFLVQSRLANRRTDRK